jgi:hypothetical protein
LRDHRQSSVEVSVNFPSADQQPTLGQLVAKTSPESIEGLSAHPVEGDRRFRDAGWWPSGGTAVKVVLIAFLVLIAIGWGLTILNK